MKKERTRKTNPQLTEGSIKTSLGKLSLPLITGAFLHNLFNLVDLFFIGRLGPVALAALSVAGVILSMLIMVALGISTGTTALIAHYTGKRDYQKADNVLIQAIVLSVICSILMLTIGLFWMEPILKIVGATAEITPYAGEYLKIAFSFSFFIFLFFAFNQSLRGSGDTLTPLKALIFANVLNIILDPLLIFGVGFFPRLEVAGSALATVISRAFGLLFLLRHFISGYSSLHLNRKSFYLNFSVLTRMVKIGFFSSLEVLMRQISLLFLIKIISLFGTLALAAYGIVVRLRLFIIMFGISTGIAASILIGQNMGSNQPKRAHQAGWQAVKYYQMLVVPIAVLFFIFSSQIIAIFTNDSEIISSASIFLKFISVSLPFLTPALVLGKGVTGAGDTIGPATMTGIFQLLWRIPVAYILANVFALKVIGVYLAISTSDLLHGITMGIYFQKGNWQKRYHRHKKILDKEN
ncbi:MAG: MATE family efflux transporter [Candidatus Omnitrophica bacterium]|nr:MATE family efflux transporter [Candidatus Omnitrophota bacterium]MCF7894254.1 MATE family efflux transporter [Candidatus Omnitrophota bacterium]